ncbi:MAG TPA: hypothetical protein VFG68_09430 [Fimbriiglobus sp.]|nr:hypothetical protein [Fimbriiglobus sp.]
MTAPKVYVDFQNAAPDGRLRLNCTGTVQDLARQGAELREGSAIVLYADDTDDDGPAELQVAGVVERSAEGGWVARIDWNAIRRVSTGPSLIANGTGPAPSVTPIESA